MQKKKKSTDTHAPPNTHTYTEEDFHCQPTLGWTLRFYAITFGNDFNRDAGEKCTGETETSCSGCWHSQRVEGRQSGSSDWIDPCEPADRSRVRGELFDWRPAVQGCDVPRHKPLSFDTTIYWFLPASWQAFLDSAHWALGYQGRYKERIWFYFPVWCLTFFRQILRPATTLNPLWYTVTHAMGIVDLKMIT